MRISTSTFYNENITTLNNLQAQVAQTQQQMSTGHRILTPADDPAGAARAVELNQADATNTQFTANRTAATNTLSLSESILQSVTSLLQDAKTAAVQAGNGTMNQSDRQSMASDLQGRYQELLGLANSTDGTGNYLFSGSQAGTTPFANTANGVVYQGDDVQRKVQAASSRQISTTDSGADIFMRTRNGNGTFQAASVVTNTGSGVISQGTVLDPTLYNGNSYQVNFSVAAGVTTYSINDMTSGVPVAVAGQSNVSYVSGQAVSFNGIQFNVTGAPADGDTFNVTPSSNQSVFDTLNNLIKTLTTPVPTGSLAASAAFSQGMNNALGMLDQNLNSVLTVRATIGSRLNELVALQSTGDQLGLQYKQTLSSIQDTDYNKAISDLTQQQMTLQAAQLSFAKVSKTSLFDYM